MCNWSVLHRVRYAPDRAIWGWVCVCVCCRLGWEADLWLSCFFLSWENSAGGCSLTDCWPLPDTTRPPAATSWLTGVRSHSAGLIIKHYAITSNNTLFFISTISSAAAGILITKIKTTVWTFRGIWQLSCEICLRLLAQAAVTYTDVSRWLQQFHSPTKTQLISLSVVQCMVQLSSLPTAPPF